MGRGQDRPDVPSGLEAQAERRRQDHERRGLRRPAQGRFRGGVRLAARRHDDHVVDDAAGSGGRLQPVLRHDEEDVDRGPRRHVARVRDAGHRAEVQPQPEPRGGHRPARARGGSDPEGTARPEDPLRHPEVRRCQDAGAHRRCLPYLRRDPSQGIRRGSHGLDRIWQPRPARQCQRGGRGSVRRGRSSGQGRHPRARRGPARHRLARVHRGRRLRPGGRQGQLRVPFPHGGQECHRRGRRR
mmetsp:Transcript_22069/g.63275  ORF Transcript_22069/g.63275 Transcript_22069/m.63275 type:complete len:242 (-) Transcript_22069:827-1552(-)